MVQCLTTNLSYKKGPVFTHFLCDCLKETVGNLQLSTTLIVLPSTFDDHYEVQPEVVLKRRVTTQDGKLIREGMIKWSGRDEANSTWENLQEVGLQS